MSEDIEIRQAAKAMIFNDNEEFIVIKIKLRNGNVVWDIPGGKLEKGESHQDALNREVYEETKFDVDIGKEIGEFSFIHVEKNFKVICKTFRCKLKKDSIGVPDFSNEASSTEHILSYEWISIKEFIDKNYVANENFILLLKSLI